MRSKTHVNISWLSGFLALLLALLLAACGGGGGSGGGGGATDTRTINASLGTWNFGGSNLGFARIIWIDLKSPTSPDGFQITVTGPTFPSSRSFGPIRFDSAGYFFFWSTATTITPVTGDHTVTASPNPDQTLNRTFRLDASASLPQPQGVSVQVTANSATYSWSPVPGAKSYYVQLWQLDQNGNLSTLRQVWYTKDTQVQFNTGVSFPQGTYRARIFAFTLDFTQLLRPGQAAQLDPQFNVSSALSQGVQVQSAGTLRVVPLPEPTVQPDMGDGW